MNCVLELPLRRSWHLFRAHAFGVCLHLLNAFLRPRPTTSERKVSLYRGEHVHVTFVNQPVALMLDDVQGIAVAGEAAFRPIEHARRIDAYDVRRSARTEIESVVHWYHLLHAGFLRHFRVQPIAPEFAEFKANLFLWREDHENLTKEAAAL